MPVRLLLAVLVAFGGSACRIDDGVVPPRGAPAATAREAPSESDVLRAALAARCRPQAPRSLRLRCEEAARLYGREPRPLWWTQKGPSPQARSLAALLREAASRGLEPADYSAGARAADVAAGPVAASVWASRDVALSLAALRFVSDLAVGRVTPREAEVALVPETEVHDLVAHVEALAHARDVEAVLASIEPPFAAYGRLLAALARYRALARDPTLAVALPARKVQPGERLPEAAALRRLLTATEDLRAAAPPADPDLYDRALAEAVARFQSRHGLAPDGVLGRATAAALGVPLEARVRQIELALERFRWLPHRFAAPPIAVNIPELWLFAVRERAGRYERADDRLAMRVIVGEAWRRQTPVFAGEMRSVVFWPFWEVPMSIAREEMLPILRSDPDYLAREHLELVEGFGARATALPPTDENLERLAAGTLRLRQTPGPHNALGLVKFLFPNPYSVYLHGTPGRHLFARERRDLSHGCIRVEEPLRLAEHVLRGEGWTREQVAEAMQGPETREVRLASPVPVFVLYVTAVARADGTVHFFEDLYGLDAKLAALLAQVPAGA